MASLIRRSLMAVRATMPLRGSRSGSLKVVRRQDLEDILKGKDPYGKDAAPKIVKKMERDIPPGATMRKRVKKAAVTNDIDIKFGQAVEITPENHDAAVEKIADMITAEAKTSQRVDRLPLVPRVIPEHGDINVLASVEAQIPAANAKRALFAIVQVAGHQFKVTESDVIVTQKIMAEAGERIRLEKILAVGSPDFSLFGTPLVDKSMVSINATVMEQTHHPTVTVFKMKRRKTYHRTLYHTQDATRLRIDHIEVSPSLQE
eukprot:Opistho-2@71737